MAFGNFTPRVMPLVRAHGALDPALTRVELEPLCVRAGSPDLSVVTVVPLDAQSLALGSGHSLSVNFGGAQHALVDLGDGRYRASLSAPASVGVYPLELLFDGQPSGAQAGLVAAGAPEFATSYLLVDSPFELIAQAPHRYKFEVQPRDAEGRALGPGTQLVVSAVPDAFGAPVSVLDQPAPNGRRDGSFFFVLEREPSLAAGSATGTVYVVADGVEVVAKPYSF
jgi:hypothetical protein